MDGLGNALGQMFGCLIAIIVLLVIVVILIIFGLLYKFTNLKNNLTTLKAAVNTGDIATGTSNV